MALLFRKLDSSDAPAYRALRLECLRLNPDHFGTTWEEESGVTELRFEKYLRENHPDHFMVGAFDMAELVGIAGFERNQRIKARHKGELVQMYIRPAYKGQKAGTALLRLLLDSCFSDPGIEEVKLSVVADNAAAVSFYRKLGFVVYASEKHYFKKDDKYWDQLFMSISRPV